MKRLVHNGVMVPELPPPTGMTLAIRNQPFVLDALQEQMAMAFVAKRHLGYWSDSVFVTNFLKDFSKALHLKPPLRPEEIDLETLFRPAIDRRERDQQEKQYLTKETVKAQAAERKLRREALREHYGHAEMDNERVEIANWTAEPNCIFMGRGKHPLRGRWKPGPRIEDITLNLSPDAPMPPGNWAGRVWASDDLWIARWTDRLSGKVKYVWVSDTAAVKQDREAQKFDAANRLAKRISQVRRHIQEGMSSPKPQERQIATASYLIDALSLRVGDEKDPDEADTVGATTLRPEHVTIKENGEVEFRFLGKDSVAWHKTAQLPPEVVSQLRELIATAQARNSSSRRGAHPSRDMPQLFPNVRSRNVNAFFNKAMDGLTAKVFRTYHASATVRNYLARAKVTPQDAGYVKNYHAKQANLQAAIVCNHTKQEPKGFEDRLQRFAERQRKANQKIAKAKTNLEQRQARLQDLLAKQKAALEKVQRRNPDAAPQKKPYAGTIRSARRSIEVAKAQLGRTKTAKDKLQTDVEIAKKTRTWNLGTSLKSYIDPRIYREWGDRIDFDWKRYYPKTLQRKFAWVDKDTETASDN
jgi:DNA topoisomerase-1